METGDSIDPHAVEAATTVVAGAPGAAAAGDTKPEFKASDDGNFVEVGGRKYVREEALHGERTKAQNYAKTLQQLEPLMPEFEQFLETRKGGRSATVDRATRGGDSDYSDDELTGYAITRGYYGEDNKPDTKRAKDDLDIMTAIADRRATRAVKPLAEGTARDRARDNTERALSKTFVDGEPIAEQKYIQAAFQSIPEEMRADEGISDVMMLVAAGLQALDDRKAGRTRGRGGREPMFREGGSGRVDRNESTLDALDQAAARARGKSPEAWARLNKVVGGTSMGGTILDEI
jgi:hypothetical protein